MKIVHVVYSLEIGGAEVLVGQLARLERANGHDVSVFAYSNLGVVGEELRADGFEIYVPGEAHPLKTMARYYRKFKAMKPDVVHCHNTAPTTQGAIPARLAGVKRVITTRHRLEVNPYHVAEELQYSFMQRFCDWVTGICETSCEQLRGAPMAQKKKVVRVYNGTRPVVREDTSALGKRGFTLVYVGRLAPEKDLGTLIRAMAMALKTDAEIYCWIIGDGRSRRRAGSAGGGAGSDRACAVLGAEDGYGAVFFGGGRVCDVVAERGAADVAAAGDEPGAAGGADGYGRGGRGGEAVRDRAAGAGGRCGGARRGDCAGGGGCSLAGRVCAEGAAAYASDFTLETMGAGYMRLYLGKG